MVELYTQGEKLITIARLFGHKPGTIKRVLKDEGLYVSGTSNAREPGYMSQLDREMASEDMLADLRKYHPDGPPTYYVARAKGLPSRGPMPVHAGLATSPAALCAE